MQFPNFRQQNLLNPTNPQNQQKATRKVHSPPAILHRRAVKTIQIELIKQMQGLIDEYTC